MRMDWFTLIYILIANRVFARSISDSTTEAVNDTTNCYRKCCLKGSTFDPDADFSCRLNQSVAVGHQDDEKAIIKEKIRSSITVPCLENIEIIYGNICPEHTERQFFKMNEDNFTLAEGQLVIHEMSRNISVSTPNFCFDFDSNSQSTVVVACLEFKVSIPKCPAGQVLNSKGNSCTLPSVQARNRNTSLHISHVARSTDIYYLLNSTYVKELPNVDIRNNGNDLVTIVRYPHSKRSISNELYEDCDSDPWKCSGDYSFSGVIKFGKGRFKGFPVLGFIFLTLWISASFLAATFLVYAVLEKLRKKQSSMNTMSLLGSASVYYFLLSLGLYYADFSPNSPPNYITFILASIASYFLFVIFAWWRIISMDLLRMFRHVQTEQQRDKNQRRRFLYDSALAWGIPLLLAGVEQLIYWSDLERLILSVEIVHICRIILTGIIVILNTINFIWVAVCYCKISIAASVSKKYIRKRLFILFRIFVLMGLTLIMDVGIGYWDNVYVVLVSLTLNTVNAVLIFVTLVCKPNVLRMFQEKFQRTIDLSRKAFYISQRFFATESEMERRKVSWAAPDLNTVASHI